jgi:hypothetical protein
MSEVERALIENAIVRAEMCITRGDMVIIRQLATIAAVERSGRNIACSKSVLSTFEESQRMHVAHLNWLWSNLRNASGPKAPKRPRDLNPMGETHGRYRRGRS